MTDGPDYEFPPRKVTPKAGWTIWSIKNRWLRAAVAWVLATLTALIAVALLVALTVISAIVGAVRNIWDDVGTFTDGGEWAPLLSSAWAAMTGKDEPQ